MIIKLKTDFGWEFRKYRATKSLFFRNSLASAFIYRVIITNYYDASRLKITISSPTTGLRATSLSW